MREIWTGRAIARGYGFLFENLPGVLAYAWLPALLYAGLRLWAVGLPPLHAPLSAQPWVLAAHIGFVLATMLLIAGIAVPLTRGALGYNGVFVLAHLHLGERELKLFWAQLRTYVLLIGLAALSGLAVAGAGRAVSAMSSGSASARGPFLLVPVTELTVAILTLGCIAYVALRLSILIYPVAALDDERPLARTWDLGRGQVLRLLLVLLGIGVPVVLVNFVVDYALFGPALFDALRSLASTSPDHESLSMLFARQPGAMTLAAALSLVVMVALHAGASAEAYRALTEDSYGYVPDLAVSADPPKPVHHTGLVPEAAAVVAESAGRYETNPAEMIPVYAQPLAGAEAVTALTAAPASGQYADEAAPQAYVPHPSHDTPDWSAEAAAADPTSHDGAYEGLYQPQAAAPASADSPPSDHAPYGSVAEAASVSSLSAAAYAYQGWAAPAAVHPRPADEVDLSAMPADWTARSETKELEPA